MPPRKKLTPAQKAAKRAAIAKAKARKKDARSYAHVVGKGKQRRGRKKAARQALKVARRASY